VGLGLFFDFSRFSNMQTLKSEMVTFLTSKFIQILQVDCLKHKEQLFFLDQPQNPKGTSDGSMGKWLRAPVVRAMSSAG
jgi:hypothetical protein